jgi:hypothetical protein
MSTQFNAIFRLRRDNDYNYAKIKDTFVPANGEICLVDTARNGLRAICGDGVHTFAELDYMGEVIVKGYYYNGNFYSDIEHTTEVMGSEIKVYVDLHTSNLYYFDGEHYQSVRGEGPIPTATSTQAGVMKLYDTVGYNTDGTMTQKAITDELDDKVELELKEDEELIIFTL